MKLKPIQLALTFIFLGTPIFGFQWNGNNHADFGDCCWKDIKLYGKVQFVKAFPDIKIQLVDHFPDLRVKYVDHFPDECGKWQVVDHFPDFKVQVVESFPDIKVKIVDHFPGMP